MTALIAFACADGVFMVTDSRRTHIASGLALPPVRKLKSLAGPTLWAKGGYGTQADILFSDLSADLRSRSGDIDLIAEATYEHGVGVYAACKQQAVLEGIEDIGLYVLMAGFDKNGSPKLRSIHFGIDEQKEFGAGMYIVMASNTSLANAAIKGLESCYIGSDGWFAADIYGLSAMKIIRRAMPEHVDLPLEIAKACFGMPLAYKMMDDEAIAIHDSAFCLRI